MADVIEDMNAFTKEVYPDGVPDLVPNDCHLQKCLGPMKQEELISDAYRPVVRLAYPGGFTHALGDGTEGAFALNDATSGVRQKATVRGAQILLKDQMSLEDAKKMVAGKRAFKNAADELFEAMQEAGKKRLESELFHGGEGMGILSAYAAGTPSITISALSWASGIWMGLEGAEIDVHAVNTSTVRGTVKIVSVDPATRIITISATVAGAVSGDYVYFKGAFGKEMTGAHGILSNAGSLFGISAATYSLWGATSYAVGSAALSFDKFKKGLAQAAARGLNGNLKLFVSPGAWDNVNSDISALRNVDKSEVSKIDIGHEKICYHSFNGKTEIISSTFVKEGFAYGICEKDWKRIGATDLTFDLPSQEGKKFMQLETKAGVESRYYTNQAVFCKRPGGSILFTGIVNS